MSDSGAAAVDRGDDREECPICLAPLPPFWETSNRMVTYCCGKDQCQDCDDKRGQHLARTAADGTFGREEKQLQTKCPMCRTQLPPDDGGAARMMLDNLENGRLPMRLLHILGSFYMTGRGVKQNKEKGVETWTLGAEKGDSNCKHSLGAAYYKGHYGLPKSSEEARKWFLAATEQGHAKAELYLAIMMRDEGNEAAYLRLMRSSASKGYDVACFNLGLAYCKGDYGLTQSTEEAIRVLVPAAERGGTDCMRLLGCLLCSPDLHLPPPLPQDNPNFAKGMHWLQKAAETRDETAVSSLSFIEKEASRRCFRCSKEAPEEKAFLRCSRCRAAWYCSKDCQVQHWKAEEGGHKQFCIKWASA